MIVIDSEVIRALAIASVVGLLGVGGLVLFVAVIVGFCQWIDDKFSKGPRFPLRPRPPTIVRNPPTVASTQSVVKR